MSADREIAKVYARQASRAGRAAVVVVISGAVGTVAFALALDPDAGAARIGILALGTAITATGHAVISHLQAQAEAAAVRHLAVASDDRQS
jgi:hypothetical protein